MKESTKGLLRLAGLSGHVDKVEAGNCPLCNKKINANEFKDELSKKEFEISGMCQKCQDEVFTEGE